jgi:hypothetical protein
MFKFISGSPLVSQQSSPMDLFLPGVLSPCATQSVEHRTDRQAPIWTENSIHVRFFYTYAGSSRDNAFVMGNSFIAVLFVGEQLLSLVLCDQKLLGYESDRVCICNI